MAKTEAITSSAPTSPNAQTVQMVFKQIEIQLQKIHALSIALESGLVAACRPGEEYDPHREMRLSQILLSMMDDVETSSVPAWRTVLQIPGELSPFSEQPYVGADE